MDLQFFSPLHGPLIFTAVSNPVTTQRHLPGSKLYGCDLSMGSVSIQEINSEKYTIRLNVFKFIKKMLLLMKVPPGQVSSHLSLKNSIRLRFQDTGKMVLNEGQFTILSEIKPTEWRFSPGNEFQVFDANYSPDLLELVFPFFPKLKWRPHTSNRIHRQWAHPHMTDIVRHMINCPFDEALRHIYFDTKVKEYLILMLGRIEEKEPDLGLVTENEIASVYQARELILSNLEKHFTIHEISLKVYVNEFKLKVLFKKLFGIGIFECLLKARMEKAKILLLETKKPIKEIAVLTGYEHITSFITAFRKHFGYTPGSLRRR